MHEQDCANTLRDPVLSYLGQKHRARQVRISLQSNIVEVLLEVRRLQAPRALPLSAERLQYPLQPIPIRCNIRAETAPGSRITFQGPKG